MLNSVKLESGNSAIYERGYICDVSCCILQFFFVHFRQQSINSFDRNIQLFDIIYF